MSKEDSQQQKKEKIVEYFRNVPVYRYAAMHVGIDEDTLALWRKADSDFSDSLNQAKADWVKGRVGEVRADWALERLEREIFSPPKQETVLSGGEDPIKIILGKYGLPGGAPDDREDNDPVSGSSENPI